jgi:hypothetical protein
LLHLRREGLPEREILMKSYASHEDYLNRTTKKFKHPSCHFLHFTSLGWNDLRETVRGDGTLRLDPCRPFELNSS